MVLHIIRHADPDYPNNTITEFGWQEAYALADYLKDIQIDKIYTSPMGRAIDTAKPTLEAKGMDYTVLPWTAESMNYMRKCTSPGGCSYRFSITDGVEDFTDFATDDREGYIQQLYENSDKFLASLGYVRQGVRYKIERENPDHIAIFCHGGFGSAWISHLLFRPAELGFLDFRIRTTSISTFEFEGKEGDFIFPQAWQIGANPHIIKAGLRVNRR